MTPATHYLAARETGIANALDASDSIDFSASADGWFKVCPYGTFRGKNPGRPQSISATNAGAMVSEFNSMLGRLGRAFRGVPIYHGHPDVDPSIWPDDRRLGKITQLEARPDGLWGLAEWNSTGQENKAEGWWIYPSPYWDAPAGTAAFTPDRLISIGLTNNPRILESEPIFNSSLITPETPTTMDPKIIREKLGLAPEATDEEILAKIDSILAAAIQEEKTENPTEKAAEMATAESLANAALAQEICRLREAYHNQLLDRATRETRITPAERPTWAARLASAAHEVEANSLASLPPKLNSASLSLADRRSDRSAADGIREQVANAVIALEATGIPYHEAWMRTKKDSKFAGYFQGQ